MLPLTRNRTYSPATPVNSQDMNDLQDMVIGGKHGARWKKFSPSSGLWVGGNVGATHQVRVSGTRALFTAVGDQFDIPICLAEGERLLAARVFARCGATDVLGCTVSWDDGANVGDLGSSSSVGHALTVEDVDITGLTELCSAANRRCLTLTILCTAHATSPTIIGGMFQTDFPT